METTGAPMSEDMKKGIKGNLRFKTRDHMPEPKRKHSNQISDKLKESQRAHPVDFSLLFNAICGKRTDKELEIHSECLDPCTTENHNVLKEILGEESLKVLEYTLAIADEVTKTLVVNEISDKFCTVLCVDLFNSIKDKGTIASNIIEACLGHIGVVSIGTETKVEQELTKDKDRTLGVIGRLQVSPFHGDLNSRILEGLFTALKLLHGRVKPTDYGSHHTLYPKIVIISDSLFKDCSTDTEAPNHRCQKAIQ